MKLNNTQKYYLQTSKNIIDVFDQQNIKSIIGGGFVRDILSHPHYDFSDIDVYIDLSDVLTSINGKEFMNATFISVPASSIRSFIIELFDPCLASPVNIMGSQNNYNASLEGDDPLKVIFEFDIYLFSNKRPTTIQIMCVYNCKLTDYINQYFDIGFCKCLYDGEKIQTNQDFWHDFNNKKLTFVRNDMTQKNIAKSYYKHVTKLKRKYPNFTVDLNHHLKYAKGITLPE